MATAARDRGLAERIVSIKRAIASIPQEPERDRVAHDLSSASLEVHWSKVSLVLATAPMTERTRAMEARLEELVPDLAAESFRVGFADDGALGMGEADAYRHMMLVSVRLDDGSWVNFSSSALGAAQHADWSVLAVTICFGVAIVVVAVLLLRWATRPLGDLAIAAERFSLDQTPERLDETGPAEVRRAARAFNTMRERIQRLVAERMQAWPPSRTTCAPRSRACAYDRSCSRTRPPRSHRRRPIRDGRDDRFDAGVPARRRIERNRPPYRYRLGRRDHRRRTDRPGQTHPAQRTRSLAAL